MKDFDKDYLEKLKNGETITIPLHEEIFTIKKEKRVVEEIIIRREKYIEMQKISIPIKKEVIVIEQIKENIK